MKLIEDNNIIYAKIIRADMCPKETTFFTDDTNEIQFGIVYHKKGHKTGAHYHNHLNSETTKTDEKQKTKKVVELTDDYIKTLENYLRSPDATVRKSGIKELINRYEEDESRYDDPALTALLNIALQDSDTNNRLFAMSPIASGSAHGDENTIKLLQNLQASDKLYGQEAKMANDALLNAAQTKVEIPDNSPEQSDKKNNE